MAKLSLCGMSAGDLSDLIGPYGFSHSQAVAVATGFYRRRIHNIARLDGIPGKLRALLIELMTEGLFPPLASEVSSDGSAKFLFRCEDGRAFESVYIPDGKRRTVCVSTQSGCRMGCPFCVTGIYGFHGDLSAGEIVNQVLSIPQASSITHVVFMGMGEPMDNIGNVLKACDILTSQWGLALSPGNITISTVGIRPGVERYLQESSCNLTLSLYSPFPGERMNVVPVEKKWPATDIINLMKEFPVRKKRRLSIAYVMLDGVNDTDSHLAELIALLGNTGIRVNLLPYHPSGDSCYISASPERMQHFRHNLVMSGISASIRKSRGEDISAACGLLATGLVNTCTHPPGPPLYAVERGESGSERNLL